MKAEKFNELTHVLEFKAHKYQRECGIIFLSIVPFIILMLLTHRLVFLEFGLVLLAVSIYFVRKTISVKEEIENLSFLSNKIKTSKVRKVYPEGHHLITNPTNAILDLGGYACIGEDFKGTKIYQNITDVVVPGEIMPSGEVIYDEFGIPTYLIK